MKCILLAIALLSISVGYSQKIYVWCPENNQVKPRKGMGQNDTVNIVFFDGRSIPSKSKIECTSEQISESIFAQIKSAYPSAVLVLQPDSVYYKTNLNENSILIKIGIGGYHAGFGSDVSVGIGVIQGHFATMVFPRGQWNAVTAYFVQVFLGKKKATKEISNISSRPNMWGYKSAKSALNECYNKSTTDLLFFIDEQFSN